MYVSFWKDSVWLINLLSLTLSALASSSTSIFSLQNQYKIDFVLLWEYNSWLHNASYPVWKDQFKLLKCLLKRSIKIYGFHLGEFSNIFVVHVYIWSLKG